LPVRRGEHPSPDDWLTDEELRDRAQAQIAQIKMDTNVKARRLAIMQEHKERTEQANALTRRK
jgi:hypothetical protein